MEDMRDEHWVLVGITMGETTWWHRRKDTIIIVAKRKRARKCGLRIFDSGYGPAAGSYEHNDDFLGSKNGGEFLLASCVAHGFSLTLFCRAS
jgi:hypothetical protein